MYDIQRFSNTSAENSAPSKCISINPNVEIFLLICCLKNIVVKMILLLIYLDVIMIYITNILRRFVVPLEDTSRT